MHFCGSRRRFASKRGGRNNRLIYNAYSPRLQPHSTAQHQDSSISTGAGGRRNRPLHSGGRPPFPPTKKGTTAALLNPPYPRLCRRVLLPPIRHGGAQATVPAPRRPARHCSPPRPRPRRRLPLVIIFLLWHLRPRPARLRFQDGKRLIPPNAACPAAVMQLTLPAYAGDGEEER